MPVSRLFHEIKNVCVENYQNKNYISTIFDGTVDWRELILHQYYKHKTFNEKKLLNFSLCLTVSAITFILYNNSTLKNCFHFFRKTNDRQATKFFNTVQQVELHHFQK